MDTDEDDDFYAPEENEQQPEPQKADETSEVTAQADQVDEDLEEGEEEDEVDEGSDSDIDIITERKDGTKPAPPSQPARYNDIRNIPQRTGSNDLTTKPTTTKKQTSKGAPQVSGKDLPGISTSKIIVDGKPIYEPAGKPITQVNIDEDLPDNDKPWRRPGTDISDYFNYGFDEFTWALYASKQESLRSEFSADKIALNSKKMFEDMNMMMAMGAMPGMITGATGTTSMTGMEGMTPEMQAMMQQMMAQGGDPSQMDLSAMFGGAAAGAAAQSGQGQGFGGQGNFGQTQNQFGYEGNNRGGGNFRGRGNRRGQW